VSPASLMLREMGTSPKTGTPATQLNCKINIINIAKEVEGLIIAKFFICHMERKD
jgi:hypothetical protein